MIKTHNGTDVVKVNITDYVDTLQPGIYLKYVLTDDDQDTTQKPVSGDGATYLICKTATNVATVIGIPYRPSTSIFIKKMYNSTWTEWQKIPITPLWGVTNVCYFPVREVA